MIFLYYNETLELITMVTESCSSPGGWRLGLAGLSPSGDRAGCWFSGNAGGCWSLWWSRGEPVSMRSSWLRADRSPETQRSTEGWSPNTRPVEHLTLVTWPTRITGPQGQPDHGKVAETQDHMINWLPKDHGMISAISGSTRTHD